MRKILWWIGLFGLGFLFGFLSIGCTGSTDNESSVAPVTSVSDVNSSTTTE